MNAKNEILSGNLALEYIFDHYSILDAKLAHLVNGLPALGNTLYENAEYGAESLYKAFRQPLLSRLSMALSKTSSDRRKLLELCIFDLQLCVFFTEVLSYCGDKELASLLADSLLYQATGYEPSSPTELEICDEGTHNARGIQKYSLSHQQFKHIGDIQAWVFGKDVSAIMYGTANDIAIIVAVSNFSLVVRRYAKSACVFALYGKLPTEEEMKNFQLLLEEENNQLKDLISKISKK